MENDTRWGYVVSARLYVDGEEVDSCTAPDGWHVFHLDDVPVDAVPEPMWGEGPVRVVGSDSILDDVPTGTLGSWDVVFSLPTYVEGGEWSHVVYEGRIIPDDPGVWYTGEEWSHPEEPQRVIADDPMVLF